MSEYFSADQGLIKVKALLKGPDHAVLLELALDTGATTTVIGREWLQHVGLKPSAATLRERIVTASGVESVPRIRVETLTALGREKADFPVLCHSLPPTALIDGILGLDFLRGLRLVVDFRKGEVNLS